MATPIESEKVWHDLVVDLERRTGRQAATLPAEEFHRAVSERLDLAAFERRS